MFFPRKTIGWGPPVTWQGWVFLALWCASFAGVAGDLRSPWRAVGALALIVFLYGVATLEE
jgi:hypothetical protein